jgi:ABC-type phosphate transport system permease subunit
MAAANQPLDVSSPSDQIAVRRWSELIIEGAIRVAGISSIVIISLIFLFLLREGLPAFLDIPLRQLVRPRWYPIEEVYRAAAAAGRFPFGHGGRGGDCVPLGLASPPFIWARLPPLAA